MEHVLKANFLLIDRLLLCGWVESSMGYCRCAADGYTFWRFNVSGIRPSLPRWLTHLQGIVSIAHLYHLRLHLAPLHRPFTDPALNPPCFTGGVDDNPDGDGQLR